MYLGLVDFRNNQQSSDSIFGINPVMLHVSSGRLIHTQSRTLSIWGISRPNIAIYFSYNYFATSFSCNMSAPTLMILGIYLALSEPNLVSKVNGKIIFLTPDTLY